MDYLIEDYNSSHLIKVNNDDENFNMDSKGKEPLKGFS